MATTLRQFLATCPAGFSRCCVGDEGVFAVRAASGIKLGQFKTRELATKRALLFVAVLLLVAVIAAACSFSFSAANVPQVVLAKDVKGDTLEPVDPTSTFPTDQAVIHLVVTVANAPSDTKVKTVWTAVDVGDAAPANTKIDEANVMMAESDNAHFTLSQPSAGT